MTAATLFRSRKTLPPFRLINAVLVLSRVAARHGIGWEPLFAGSGLVPDDLCDPLKRITISQELTVTRNLGRLLPQVPWIGLDVGREYHFSANGKLGLAMMCCETLMDALKLAMTYSHLTNTYHQYTLRVKNGTGYGDFKECIDLGDLRRPICEAEVTSLHAMAMLGHEGSTVFRELHFAYPRPPYGDKYEELFKCRICFDAPSHTIIFDAKDLDKPLRMANPLVKDAMEKECRRLFPLLQHHESMAERVHQELLTHMDGFPDLEQMARRISLSPRTLRRRLLEERTSYKNILADVRKKRAVELLKTTRLPVDAVASSLGFSEVSSFYRAFKSWTGLTPSSFREKDVSSRAV